MATGLQSAPLILVVLQGVRGVIMSASKEEPSLGEGLLRKAWAGQDLPRKILGSVLENPYSPPPH